MKLFKLIKSIDYVSYPAYKELVKISDAVSNSIANFRDMIVSTFVGVLFDKTPLSCYIITYVKNNVSNSVVKDIVQCQNADLILSIFIGITIFLLIKTVCFIISRFGSNKNTKKKRDILVHEFYNVAIPQLIEVKSIMEQIQEDNSCDNRKKTLLLLQAKHEICDLYRNILNMNIIEKNKTGVKTDDSFLLSCRISNCAYINFLDEMLDIMYMIYTELHTGCCEAAKEDIEDIRSTINSSGIFNKVDEIQEKLQSIRKIINPPKQEKST